MEGHDIAMCRRLCGDVWRSTCRQGTMCIHPGGHPHPGIHAPTGELHTQRQGPLGTQLLSWGPQALTRRVPCRRRLATLSRPLHRGTALTRTQRWWTCRSAAAAEGSLQGRRVKLGACRCEDRWLGLLTHTHSSHLPTCIPKATHTDEHEDTQIHYQTPPYLDMQSPQNPNTVPGHMLQSPHTESTDL